MGVKTIEENLIEIKSNYIRHDAKYISNIIVNLALTSSLIDVHSLKLT